ncbi:MAG: complex I subunit 4 family protein [Luteolibacter sp.]
MLSIIVFLPLLAFAAILLGSPARQTAVAAAAANLALGLWATFSWQCESWSASVPVLATPSLNLSFGFIDGMSAVMVALSVLVTLAATLSAKCPEGREKLWFSSILLMSSGALGAFASTDLFFFFAFHELALIPTFLMIGLLGRGERREIAWKITIYLSLGSIVLLAGLVWLANLAGTFDMPTMAAMVKNGELAIDPTVQKSIAALLIIGFGTLVSLFPFHSWAAPAYASAPAPIAMLHAGVLKKFGLYGLIRVALPIVPEGMHAWLNVLLVLLLGNLLWVGMVTISQKRLDTMLGSASVMHMGYIFLGIAAMMSNPESTLGFSAAVLLMFAHGISVALLYSLADRIERATGSLDFADLGGLAKAAPALTFTFGIAAFTAMGLTVSANFVGEVLVFLSAFECYVVGEGLRPLHIACILAIWGVVISAVYMLRAFRNIFHGPAVDATRTAPDLAVIDRVPALLLALPLLCIGLYPNLLLNLLKGP